MLMKELEYSIYWINERERIIKLKIFGFPPHEKLLGFESGANYVFARSIVNWHRFWSVGQIKSVQMGSINEK